MRIHFGLAIQDQVLPRVENTAVGVAYFGPKHLLIWLEQQLGLRRWEDNVAHLRIEQYRQALKLHLAEQPDVFYAHSFAADDLGTAAGLLARRDELLAAGWTFTEAKANRLRVMNEIEELFHRSDNTLQLYAGLADRLVALLPVAARITMVLEELVLCDARAHFPPAWQRLFAAWEAAGLSIVPVSAEPSPNEHTDLGQWQAFLQGQITAKETKLRGDGSLLLLRAYRETHAAAYLARLLQQHPTYRPSLLLPNPNRTLDSTLNLEGLPSLGVAATSLARPSLQVLKLAPAFLWEPVDLFKIMEFVSLAVTPLEPSLAQRIATFLADTPGLFSSRWYAMINQYFDQELPARYGEKRSKKIAAIRREYDFWFNRPRVDSRNAKVSKTTVLEIYRHLHEWAGHQGREKEASSLLVLAAQAGRIVELLEALPEADLGYLELERIVRTIYEPAPLNYRTAEAHHLPYTNQAGAVIGPVDELIWWDFYEAEPDYFFSRWYPQELAELTQGGIFLESPAQQNERLLAQRKRPLLRTRERLILCIYDFCNGDAVQAHPLYGDLMAAFGEDLTPVTLHIDQQLEPAAWSNAFRLPQLTTLAAQPLKKPEPFLRLKKSLAARERETATSLDALLYYPYQWVFRHHIKLHGSNILSVVEDRRLLGNLAHSLLEDLLRQDYSAWSKSELEQWVSDAVPPLLRKEGATLLLYGREPEKVTFTNRMKYAAWSLISLIKDNNWRVEATEKALEGSLGPLALKGRADLVLERGQEKAIIDLKWRGLNYYTNRLTSGEDIQLALYAQLEGSTEQWAHTAYYIIERGRLLTRNTRAFNGVQPVMDEVDHEEVYPHLVDRVLSTYRWRLAQLQEGLVEIRCGQTQADLEDHYGEALLDVLEMKREDARFDDYDVLIGLCE